MIDEKIYHKKIHKTMNQQFIIEGPINAEQLSKYTFHKDLTAFRLPQLQHEALIKVADMEGSRIIVTRLDDEIIGYIAITYPDPLEYWSKGNMNDLIELGAIEVALPYRKLNIAKEMLFLSFLDPDLEHFIVITTLYYWHWDLKNSNLSVWKYQKMIQMVMEKVGFEVYSTNDPEVKSDPANIFMARIGQKVPSASIDTFDVLRNCLI